MKRLLFLLMGTLALVATSCSKEKPTGPDTRTDGTEVAVEIPVYTSAVTRATEEGTPDENAVQTLDLLVFKGGKFQYWRNAYKSNGNFRATLKIDTGIDVYFLANSRSIVEALFTSDAVIESYKDSSWETLRALLIDTDPTRLVQTSSTFTSLPMWGKLTNQKVEDISVNHWATVDMLRSVASVDVYLKSTVDNFILEGISLYFVPNKGYIGVADANYENKAVKAADAPSGMTTTLKINSSDYNTTTRSIANKLYLYDNTVKEGDALTDNARHTRLVIKGKYQGQSYYYPVDFENADGDLLTIMRNWKHVFIIESVSGRGYTDEDVASKEPPIHMNVNVIDWNLKEEGDFGVSGPYYVWLQKKSVTLTREAGAYAKVKMTSNVQGDLIDLAFSTTKNGTVVDIDGTDPGMVGDGIQNDRFRVEKVLDGSGFITELRITAVANYNGTNLASNTDEVVITAGRIRFVVAINQISSSYEDWEDGGGQDVWLQGK